MIVKKLDAAYQQLNTAIFLFFQDIDPISVHTLVGAALEVFNNHITDKNVVYDNNLITHYDTIYARDDKRRDYHKFLTKYKNFFKHANNDPYSEIDFNPEINELFIMDAIHVYEVVTGTKATQKPILAVFLFWFIVNHPNLCKEKYAEAIIEQVRLNSLFTHCDIKNKKDCFGLVKYCIENKKDKF